VRGFAIGLVAGSLGLLRLTLSPDAVFALVYPLAALLVLGSTACVVRRRCPVGGTLVLGALAGALWSLLACQGAASRVIDARLIGVDVTVEGQVLGVPRRDGRRLAFEFRVDAADTVTPFAPERLRLSRYGAGPGMRAGERWRLTIRPRPLSTLRNAGGFDRVRYLLGRGIDASGTVRRDPSSVRLAEGRGLDARRERLGERLATLGDGSRAESAAALARALVLGLPDDVPDATRELLRDTGTAHLLAISGLHVTLVAGWGIWLGRRLARSAGVGRDRAALLGLLTGLALAAGYALLAGAELPVRRALAMLAVCAVAAFRLRALPPATALAAALVAGLAVDPLAVLSVGFWLSFGTVAALVWLHAGRLQAMGDGLVYRLRSVVALGRTHLLLGVLLLPVTAWFFQSGASVAPLANLLAVPVVALLIVPLAFAALALALVWPFAASLALSALERTSTWLFGGLSVLLEQGGGAWTLALPSLESLVLAVAGLGLLFAPRGFVPRPLALLLLLPALLANARGSRVDGFELHVLDVGQGLAALVLTEEQTWLYDTGGRLAPGLSMLEVAVVPYLHTLGRRRIDGVIVSHPDSDHAAGLDDARARWPAARVIVGVPAGKNMPPDAEACRAGKSETHDGVTFSFLHPAADDAGSENDLSCVLLVHTGAGRALLTGDIERLGERRLVERVGNLSIDVMTAPHHGSRTSSSAALLRTFTPAHVVFPAGHRNAFGFPHADVRMRYNESGAVSHVTARDGALRFAFGPAGLLAPPSSWHGTRLRFWHDMVEPPCPSAGTTTGEHAPPEGSAPIPGQSSCGKS